MTILSEKIGSIEVILLFVYGMQQAAEKAQEIFKNLKILLEVADKGNKGLLTGDLHPKMIDGFCKILP